MSTELFLTLWAAGTLLAALVIAGIAKAGADRERHYQQLKQEADHAAEREARNRVFPTEGKTVRIWK